MNRKFTFLLLPLLMLFTSFCSNHGSNAGRPKYVGLSGMFIGVERNNQLVIYGRSLQGYWSDIKTNFTIPAGAKDIFSLGTGEMGVYMKGKLQKYVEKEGKWHAIPDVSAPNENLQIGEGYDRIQSDGGYIACIKKNTIEFFPFGQLHEKKIFTAPETCTSLFMASYYCMCVVTKNEIAFYFRSQDNTKWELDPNAHFKMPAGGKAFLPFSGSNPMFGVVKDKGVDLYTYDDDDNRIWRVVSTFTF